MLLDERGFFDCNQATVGIFGCRDKREFCTKHPADLSPPLQPCGTDSMKLANIRIRDAMEKGSNRFEWMHKRLDTGKPFPAEVLLNSMELDGRRVLQAVVRDITERHEMANMLRESEQRLKSILDAVQVGVMLVDAESHAVLDVNPYALNVIRLEREAVLGRKCHRFVCPNEEGDCPISDRGMQVVRKECEVLDGRGGSVPVIKTVAVQEIGGRRVFVESFVDITDRKRAEEEKSDLLQRLQSMLDNIPAYMFLKDTDGR